MKHYQSGFAHIVLIVGVVLVLGIGFAGYRVMNGPEKAQQSKQDNADAGDGSRQTAHEGTPGLLASAEGAFKSMPFLTEEIRLVTVGKETGDPRFVYPWVKSGSAKIYAPADGVLFKIRHKVYELDGKKGNDYDMFFQVSRDTVFRFNHITDPRADIKATYPAGDLPSGDYANGGMDIAERVKPTTAIAVKAGELLGSTTGTVIAHNFDFAVGTEGSNPNAREGELYAVCPFSVFNEPMKTDLLNLLGPKSGSPQPGYPCDIASEKF